MADTLKAGRNDGLPPAPAKLAFDTDFSPTAGELVELAPGISRIVGPNAGPYTFTGTNTYLIGDGPLVVLDPGPDVPRHLEAIMEAIGARQVMAILLTHTHRDHSASATRISRRIGAPIWFGGQHRLSRPQHRFEFNVLAGSCDWDLVPDRVLNDSEEISVGAHKLRVMATPGHCSNHLSFGVADTDYLFSGDHVMGWNSTLVATPDGDMSDYFQSLDRLIDSPWVHYLPGHGGPISDGRRTAQALKAHRDMRNTQIVEAVDAGARRVLQIVTRLYPGVPRATRRAAAMTVLAHVEHLARDKRLEIKWRWGRVHIKPV